MDRRDALKALTSLAASTGMTITPVTSHHGSSDIALIVLKTPRPLSRETCERIREHFPTLLAGTPLEGVKVAVLADGLDLEIVRTRSEATEVQPGVAVANASTSIFRRPLIGPLRWVCKRCGKPRRRAECLSCGNSETLTDEPRTSGAIA